jgi:hypothetical protein
MWCWVLLKWEILRIPAFCVPVWVVIFITLTIFIRIGLYAFKKGWERCKLHQELEGDRELSASSNPFPTRGVTKTAEVVSAEALG